MSAPYSGLSFNAVLFSRHTLTLLVPWTLIIVGISVVLLSLNHQSTLRLAANEARTYHRLNLHYRAWGASLGGVYADTAKVSPNPYLTLPDRDVTTTGGKTLTLINPAYMTRMVFERVSREKDSPVLNKLTSTKPLNPANMADDWERQGLESFARREATESSQLLSIDGKPYLRLLSQFLVEPSCLKCHASQGYKEGDVRGGLSIAVPLARYYKEEQQLRNYAAAGFTLLWGMGSAGILYSSRRRLRYEEELRQRENRFRIVCDWAQGWEYWTNPDGSIEYMSPSCEEITGYTPEEFYSCDGLAADIVYREDRHIYSQHTSDTAAPADELEFRIVRKDGEIRWIHHICRPVAIEGQNRGRRVSNRDITDKKNALDRQQEAEQRLLFSQKLESLGVLAGGIAHDFNNILTAIIGNAELALMRLTPDSPAQSNILGIEKAAGRAADLAKQMLAYSGKGRFVVEPIDLNRLIEEMSNLIDISISKNTQPRYNFTKPLPSIDVDATQIRQIILNLVINASEAIGEKCGVIAITTGSMECDAGYLKEVWLDENLREGLYVYLEITDSGCGMSKETLEKIFDPFFTTKFTGRGLGMAAVLGIVRGHKGAIKVSSEEGKGSSFKILLPASSKPEPANLNQSGECWEWKGSGTALLVDDEETVQLIGTEMLKELGFQVISARNGREAVELFKTIPGISVVILDLTMPQMDGEQCFRELRKLDPQATIIMSSGYSEQEVTPKFSGMGLAGFVQKPYKLAGLRESLGEALKKAGNSPDRQET